MAKQGMKRPEDTHPATGESQGQGSLVGCRLWGRTESDTTEATQQQGKFSTWILVPCLLPFSGILYFSINF